MSLPLPISSYEDYKNYTHKSRIPEEIMLTQSILQDCERLNSLYDDNLVKCWKKDRMVEEILKRFKEEL